VIVEPLRLGFARVLVEVDVNSEFPKEIEILGLGGEINKVGIEEMLIRGFSPHS
jgi:hypothetical protein